MNKNIEKKLIIQKKSFIEKVFENGYKKLYTSDLKNSTFYYNEFKIIELNGVKYIETNFNNYGKQLYTLDLKNSIGN